MLLLPPGTRTLSPGEATGLILTLDGPVLPGTYIDGSYFSGFNLLVPGPDNLPPGTYSLNARDAAGVASSAAVATMVVKMVTPPVDDLALISVLGNYANSRLTSSGPISLAPGNYDVVPVATPAAA